MIKESALRLLVIEDSANDAETYVRTLVSSGQAVRPAFLKPEDEIENVIKDHQPDVIILKNNNTLISLEELAKTLDSLDDGAPIILACKNADEISISDAMSLGAKDRIIKDDLDHLKLVVLREFEYINLLHENQKLSQAYKESEIRCQSLMQNSRDAIAYVHEGMHIYANDAYLETFGFESFDDIEGLPIMDMVSAEQQDKFKSFLRTFNADDNQKTQLEIDLVNTKDEPFKGNMEFSPASIDGEPCTEIIIRQQADSKELEEQIDRLSKLDPLTGLLNRQAFLEYFDETIDKVNDKKHYALLQLGIDNFKGIQESAGLVGSDQVIAEVAGIIKNKLKEHDVAARYEGSKYLIITDAKEDKIIEILAANIMSAANDHICVVSGKSITIECSIGATIIDDASLDFDEVILRSEKAYQQALEGGGKQLQIYRPKEGEMTQKQLDAAWIKRIKTALDENRFHLLYQPIVQLDGGDVERYEVFVELRDEEGNRVSPKEFLPAAERTKVSKVIDRWVIKQALAQLTIRLKKNPNTVFFVKLTGGSLEDTELFRWISERIKISKLPKWRLIFEVKEAAVVSHLKQAQAFATLLKTIQCGFAIDDFGTGPDPFKLLEHIPAQFLKFTKEFCQDLPTSPQNQETLKEICIKAKELKKYTIVPHIEDAATLSVLWTIGTNFIQGNFFQGPSEKMDYDFSSGLG